MKKQILILLSIFLLSGQLLAQEKISNLFQEIQTNQLASLENETQTFINTLSSAKVLSIDKTKNLLLFGTKNNYHVTIPTKTAGVLELELTPANIVGANFKVKTPEGDVPVVLPTFYWGKVVGSAKSFVTITVTEKGLEGMIITDNYNFTIGKIKNSSTDLHIIYETGDIPNNNPIETEGPIIVKPDFNGGNNNSPNPNTSKNNDGVNVVTGCRAVEIYMEADYQTYLDLGSSVPNVTTYISSIFNNVAQLYAKEGVNVVLSSLYVWTATDPYASATNTADALYLFDNITFTGDLAHLVSTKGLGGGIAYLQSGTSVYGGMTSRAVFQNCSHGSSFGVSASLSTTVVNIPTFSWNVEVITHELGHNFGLPHTHSCTWPGGAIDNCGPTAGYVEGSCVPPAIPSNTGTIMSYCHLTSTGINFLYGFGPMPGDKLRAEVAAASCLGGSVALVPIGSPATRCGAGTVTLTASGCSGTYNWYSTETGGTVLSSLASYTTPSISSTTTYYVDCTVAANCASKRAAVQAIMGANPPTATGGSGCGTNVNVTLSASGCNGGTYLWYNALTGGTSIGTGSTFITPAISTNTTYYVSCNLNSCPPTARTAAVATVTSVCNYCTPDAQNCTDSDVITNVKILSGTTPLLDQTSSCSANGYSYTTSPVPDLEKSSTYTISVSNPNTYSEGSMAWIDYNKNGSFESSEIIFTQTSSRWSNATGTFVIPTTGTNGLTRMRIRLSFNSNPTDPCTNASTYGETEDYLVNIIGGCSVNPPTSLGGSRCGAGTLSLTATGCGNGTINWYTSTTGGTSVGLGTSYTTPSLTSSTSYYISCTVGTCVSTRSSVAATINAIPTAPTSLGGSRCGAGTLSLTATGCGNGTINWYTSTTGGTSVGLGTSYTTPSLTSSTSYYISCTVGTCVSTRSSVAATINAIPTAPSSLGGSRCGAGTLSLTATGCGNGTINWYTSTTGGTSVGLGTSYTTPSLTSSRSYYISCTVGSCVSTRSAVAATVNAIPTAPSSLGGSRCGAGTLNLTATGCGNGTINWYTSTTGGTSVGLGTSYTTPSITSSTSYYISCTVGSCVSVRSAVAATVNIDLTYSNILQVAGSYNASQTIMSAANIATGTNYYAGKSITLSPGFQAGSNEVFLAKIQGCQ